MDRDFILYLEHPDARAAGRAYGLRSGEDMFVQLDLALFVSQGCVFDAEPRVLGGELTPGRPVGGVGFERVRGGVGETAQQLAGHARVAGAGIEDTRDRVRGQQSPEHRVHVVQGQQILLGRQEGLADQRSQ